jgi:hypothetical protein
MRSIEGWTDIAQELQVTISLVRQGVPRPTTKIRRREPAGHCHPLNRLACAAIRYRLRFPADRRRRGRFHSRFCFFQNPDVDPDPTAGVTSGLREEEFPAATSYLAKPF